MENTITIQNNYNTLDKLYNFLNIKTQFECTKTYDTWDVRTGANGQMEECIVLKKSSMHAVKLYFSEENKVKVNHIIPNKVMHAYFGKCVKAHRNILELITGQIKAVALKGSQQKAFDELSNEVRKASA
ncbi:MAG TPA: hypothetical protein DEA82_12390 [Flavobacteriaceae bacterium]|nr:hypothetical protein [Flavobacteriaceae bacterium]HBR54927.1 hypothetical protein [Flavobacteriaceae bacterium]